MIAARARSRIGERFGRCNAPLFAAALCMNAMLAVAASGEEPLIGQRVIQKGGTFQLRVGSKVIDTRGCIEIFRVEQESGHWLWLTSPRNDLKGWARDDQVVPVGQAIAFFTAKIRQNRDDPLPYVLRARVWEDKSEMDIALGDLVDAIRLDPTHPWVYNWRGILWRHKKNYEKAIADHTEAIKLEPREVISYVNRALAFLDAGQVDKAIDDLNQAIRLDPEDARNFNKRGWAWYSKGFFDKAIEDFNKAIALDPELEDAWNNRGMAWFAKGDLGKAIADYSGALKLDPKDAFVYNNRGWAWQEMREYDKAVADFNQALRFRPNFVRAFTNRGIVRTSRKEFDKAIDDFDSALRIDPRRVRTLTNRGIAWMTRGDLERAIADFNEAIRLDSTAIWPRYNRLLAYLAAGRRETLTEARKLLDQVGWQNELSVYTAVIGHLAALRAGQGAEADRFLVEAVAAADRKQWTYQIVRFLRGEITDEQMIATAAEPSRQTEGHAFAGLTYEIAGRLEKALPHFQWVRDNGVASDAGYRLSLLELGRIHGSSASLPPLNQTQLAEKAETLFRR